MVVFIIYTSAVRNYANIKQKSVEKQFTKFHFKMFISFGMAVIFIIINGIRGNASGALKLLKMTQIFLIH